MPASYFQRPGLYAKGPAADLCRRPEKPEDITESALATKNEELQLAESQRQYRAFLTARLTPDTVRTRRRLRARRAGTL